VNALQPQQSLQVGTRVTVRQQRWLIVHIQAHSACRVLSLAGATTRNAGRLAQVIVPFDEVAPVVMPSGLRLLGVQRWRRQCRAMLAAQGPAARLQTAGAAHIDLLPHQLEPVLAIVQGRACRVLIADEVGLGKTIQAGLIAAELRAREAAARVLVLTPAGLREQWTNELKLRFGIDAAIVDMRGARLRAASLPVGVNPWSTVEVAVTSFDYVKRPEVAPAITSCPWDLVIVDEAHGVTAGSERREVVDAICRRTSYVVLLTATPHSGSRAAFQAICAIGVQPSDRFLVFRRNRTDAGLTVARSVHRLFVRPSPAERETHGAVADVMNAAAAEAHRSHDTWLAMSVLLKRSLSSAHSLYETVARRLRSFAALEPDAWQLCLPLADATGDLDASDEAPLALAPLLRHADGERRWLTRLADRAAQAARSESKLFRLRRLLGRLRRLSEPSIVFTEYRDTLLHVRHALPIECAVLHGGLTREERRAELESFVNGHRAVLLATDAGGEGLNLHMACRVVINLELPWNPTRLEQRIGRVDRIGQRRRVHVFHLIARGTAEMQILESLKEKVALARRDIDAADPLGFSDRCDDDVVIAQRLAGLAIDNTNFTDAAAPLGLTRLEADAARELRRLIDARRFTRQDRFEWPLATDGWFAAVTQLSSTRMHLRGRLLVLVHDRLVDDHGRWIASRVLSILLSVRCRLPASDRRHLLSAMTESGHRHALESAGSSWRAEMRRLHQLFVTARMERDSAILASLDDGAVPSQMGLFERRGQREAADRKARTEEMKQHVSNRIAASATSTTDATEANAVLMLVPSDRW
jgi:superfamily II DNA or RNA helicase